MFGSPSAPARTFEDLGDAVPRYERFFTVDEHRERDRALAADYDHVSYAEHGESAGGDPLWTVRVGSGSRTALLFGAPHPNEPIGTMTIDFLLHELATNDALRGSLDYEFVCMPVADPDGLRLNEGWFDGPFTLSNYAQNFYRPPPHQQVEATFPVERDDYAFDDPTPATRALADVVDAHEPEFVYSLHNAAFGGCFYYLTEPMEPLHATLQSLPEAYGVPLHHGEPERADYRPFDDAIFELHTFDDQYEDAMADEDGSTDPLLGGTAYDYASRVREGDGDSEDDVSGEEGDDDDVGGKEGDHGDGGDDVVALVVELPYFFDPRIRDRTELDRSRETVIREAHRDRRPLFRELRAAVRAVDDHLPDTPMAEEGAGGLLWFAESSAGKAEWAAEVPETDAPATVAQRLDERYCWEYHVLTYAGMLLRSIDQAAMGTDDETVHRRLVDAKAAVESVFHERIGRLQANLDYETIPIWKLVAIQARAGLVCLDHLQHRPRE